MKFGADLLRPRNSDSVGVKGVPDGLVQSTFFYYIESGDQPQLLRK